MRLYRSASGNEESFLGGSSMASNFAPFHWDVPRRVHVAGDSHAYCPVRPFTVAACCFRGSDAGAELQQLVESALVRVHLRFCFVLGRCAGI